MSENRPTAKLDFTSGFESLPPRPKHDAITTHASVVAGKELGFVSRANGSLKIDGRRLRSRGATTQMNLKVTAAEKEMILREANRLMQDPTNPVNTIGEFVVHVIDLFRSQR